MDQGRQGGNLLATAINRLSETELPGFEYDWCFKAANKSDWQEMRIDAPDFGGMPWNHIPTLTSAPVGLNICGVQIWKVWSYATPGNIFSKSKWDSWALSLKKRGGRRGGIEGPKLEGGVLQICYVGTLIEISMTRVTGERCPRNYCGERPKICT